MDFCTYHAHIRLYLYTSVPVLMVLSHSADVSLYWQSLLQYCKVLFQWRSMRLAYYRGLFDTLSVRKLIEKLNLWAQLADFAYFSERFLSFKIL